MSQHSNEDTNNLFEEITRNQETIAAEALQEKLADAQTPGFEVEFDPEEAEMAGAFTEDALSEEDALESSVDLADS